MAIKTVDDLNDYMKIHGNTRLGEFELNDKLIECVKELNEIEFNPVKELNLHYITKSRMKKNAKEFLTQFYKFWNVGYLPDSKLKRIIKWKKISCEGEIISLYNAAAKMIDPFKLPIKYDKDNVFDGRLVTQVLYRKIDGFVFQTNEVQIKPFSLLLHIQSRYHRLKFEPDRQLWLLE